MAAEHVQTVIYHLAFHGVNLDVTKPVIVMWVVSAMVFLFLTVANFFSGVRRVERFLFDFIHDAFGSSLHTKKTIWFSFLVTLFLFIFLCNLSGLVPFSESPTSGISVTAAMAVVVFLVSQLVGVYCHGFRHLKVLVPSGIPVIMLPFIIPLELISQLARPFSLAIRLFANMFAGHSVMLIFLGLITSATFPLLKLLPFAGVVLLSMFEIFVAFIQAFIFTYLASFYISDAAHGAH
ncbi:ATP synthase F0 subunit A [bacterium]|nr:ATP synthase F0 subunit A [bacterium]